MKKIATLAGVLFAFLISYAQNATEKPVKTPGLVFATDQHDFGKIAQGKPVYFNFDIENTTDKPIVLNHVQASCGCTTPEWDHEPIAPGASSVIKVGYNAAAEGHFEKVINITYNESETKQLKITGTVWKVPMDAAPANASVQFLKKQSQ